MAPSGGRGSRVLHFVSRVAAFAGVAALLWSDDAAGRAGGGEHYSGGRSSGGGGGGGSFGGGGGGGGGDGGALIELAFRLIYWSIRLTVEYPKFMIPVWIVVFLLWRWWASQQPGAQTQGAMLELDRQRLRAQSDLDRRLDALKKADPGFERGAFLRRTEQVFLAVQEAWFRRDLGPARAYMSDSVHRRFAVLLGLMKDEGRRDAVDSVKVIDRRILSVTRSAAFDAITVRIDAVIRDTEVPSDTSDDEARRAAKHSSPEEFTELWTFVRRAGVSPNPGYDLVGRGQCPNCGAPFHGGQSGKCDHCGAIVNSGAYDWVLSEITQASEFLPHAAQAPGFGALRHVDPAASVEVLEDRASLLFWKWVAATHFAKPALLKKVAVPGAVEALERSLAETRERNRTTKLKFPAVGGTDVLAVQVGVDGFDVAHVDVRWSAADAIGSEPRPRPRRHVVVMRRRSGVKSDEKVGLSGERCTNCGAPLTESDAVTCDYCGTDLAAAQDEWTLVAVQPHATWRNPLKGSEPRPAFVSEFAPAAPEDVGHEGLPPLPALATLQERLRILRLLVQVAKADGVVTAEERRLLKAYARRWEVDWTMIEGLIRGNSVDDPIEVEQVDPEVVLGVLVQAAKVDGRIDRRERALILASAKHLGVEGSRAETLMQ